MPNQPPPLSQEEKIALANFLGSTMKNSKQLDSSVIEHAGGSRPPAHTEHVIQKCATQIESLASNKNVNVNMPGSNDNMPPLATLPESVLPIPELIPVDTEPLSEEYLAAKLSQSYPQNEQPPSLPDIYPSQETYTKVEDDQQLNLNLIEPKGDLKLLLDAIERVENKISQLFKLIDKLGNSIK